MEVSSSCSLGELELMEDVSPEDPSSSSSSSFSLPSNPPEARSSLEAMEDVSPEDSSSSSSSSSSSALIKREVSVEDKRKVVPQKILSFSLATFDAEKAETPPYDSFLEWASQFEHKSSIENVVLDEESLQALVTCLSMALRNGEPSCIRKHFLRSNKDVFYSPTTLCALRGLQVAFQSYQGEVSFVLVTLFDSLRRLIFSRQSIGLPEQQMMDAFHSLFLVYLKKEKDSSVRLSQCEDLLKCSLASNFVGDIPFALTPHSIAFLIALLDELPDKESFLFLTSLFYSLILGGKGWIGNERIISPESTMLCKDLIHKVLESKSLQKETRGELLSQITEAFISATRKEGFLFCLGKNGLEIATWLVDEIAPEHLKYKLISSLLKAIALPGSSFKPDNIYSGTACCRTLTFLLGHEIWRARGKESQTKIIWDQISKTVGVAFLIDDPEWSNAFDKLIFVFERNLSSRSFHKGVQNILEKLIPSLSQKPDTGSRFLFYRLSSDAQALSHFKKIVEHLLQKVSEEERKGWNQQILYQISSRLPLAAQPGEGRPCFYMMCQQVDRIRYFREWVESIFSEGLEERVRQKKASSLCENLFSALDRELVPNQENDKYKYQRVRSNITAFHSLALGSGGEMREFMKLLAFLMDHIEDPHIRARRFLEKFSKLKDEPCLSSLVSRSLQTPMLAMQSRGNLVVFLGGLLPLLQRVSEREQKKYSDLFSSIQELWTNDEARASYFLDGEGDLESLYSLVVFADPQVEGSLQERVASTANSLFKFLQDTPEYWFHFLEDEKKGESFIKSCFFILNNLKPSERSPFRQMLWNEISLFLQKHYQDPKTSRSSTILHALAGNRGGIQWVDQVIKKLISPQGDEEVKGESGGGFSTDLLLVAFEKSLEEQDSAQQTPLHVIAGREEGELNAFLGFLGFLVSRTKEPQARAEGLLSSIIHTVELRDSQGKTFMELLQEKDSKHNAWFSSPALSSLREQSSAPFQEEWDSVMLRFAPAAGFFSRSTSWSWTSFLS